MFKSNSLRINFSIKDQDDNAVDLSQAVVEFTVKEEKGSGQVVISKSSEVSGQIEIDDTETGVCYLRFEPEDTNTLAPKTYIYELLIKLPAVDGSGYDRYTAEVGDFNLEDTVINYKE